MGSMERILGVVFSGLAVRAMALALGAYVAITAGAAFMDAMQSVQAGFALVQ